MRAPTMSTHWPSSRCAMARAGPSSIRAGTRHAARRNWKPRASATNACAMPAAEELVIALPHATLAARRWGDASSPPLLALHGWLDNAGSFDALAPLLAARWQVIALDFAGHGRSSHLAAGSWY